MTVLSVL